ncbi:P-loop containing nucleoside triphosphate hydrolase protein [Agrocybe pediades]|nr:P-loop containing nucleoside triphosphate hydrolase protein [Agrocybe pediades]
MLREIASIRECRPLFLLFLILIALSSVIPAIALSYSGQLLQIVESAVEHRKIDTDQLVSVVFGAFLSSAANHLLTFGRRQISRPLSKRIELYYTAHIFNAYARLDVPTYNDPAVKRQLEQAFPARGRSTLAFSAVNTFLSIISTVVQLASQSIVLYRLLRSQQDGLLLAFLSAVLAYYRRPRHHQLFLKDRVWVATTKDKDYIKAQGLKITVNESCHRQEIVAAGLAPFLLEQYRIAISRMSVRASHFYEALDENAQGKFMRLLIPEVLRGLPEIIFALRAVQHPRSIPLSLASLHLIKQTTTSFATTAFAIADQTESISDIMTKLIQFYEVANIPNRVQDPPKEEAIAFPENDQSLKTGISVEFRDVSFRYPGSEEYALRNVSFKIDRGQLCVIVGNNGSGKSTILKLIARLYDPTSGVILIDGQDIKTLKLPDLRRALSVLFQDYTIFPLSVRDNISLGFTSADPAELEEQTHRAAVLGGADAFVRRLSEGYDTYLDPPVQDHYSALPEGTSATLNGKPITFEHVRRAAGILHNDGPPGVLEGSTASLGGGSVNGGGGGMSDDGGDWGASINRHLSGGQMQRIALSRTFMRSVVSEESVGMLLFDEPSASLDPTAEHDLFERLRQLRGNKTMIFSSHRFGNLTRHADLILYMNDSVVVEEGTHEQLLSKQGEYARIWMLQARAFL